MSYFLVDAEIFPYLSTVVQVNKNEGYFSGHHTAASASH